MLVWVERVGYIRECLGEEFYFYNNFLVMGGRGDRRDYLGVVIIIIITGIF